MALEEFYGWFRLAPRPGFTKATVSAWRVSLEARALGSSSWAISEAIWTLPPGGWNIKERNFCELALLFELQTLGIDYGISRGGRLSSRL